MLKRILDLYDKRISIIGTFVEQIYQLSMTVVIFLGHNAEGFVGTYSYKFFIAIFMAFGQWTFEIKKSPTSKMSIEILSKFITVTLAATIIAKVTGEIKLSGLYSGVFYPVSIILLYSITNKRFKWNDLNIRCSKREYLEKKFGRNVSVIPSVVLFFAILLPGIFNASNAMFLSSLILAVLFEQIFVGLWLKKSKRLNERII